MDNTQRKKKQQQKGEKKTDHTSQQWLHNVN